MREKDVERALIRAVGKSGGMCLKFVSPGWDGAPDRLCLWPGGSAAFAEVKRPGQRPRPLQAKRIAQLRKMGFHVAVIDTPEGAEAFAADEEIEKTQFGGGGLVES